MVEASLLSRLSCLIVRQPYASLIAFGKKRWEFRSYEVKKRGTIGIAASPNPPYPTKNVSLNRVATEFPRGVLLATADLVGCFYATAADLRKATTPPIEVSLHNHKILTVDSPIGEPKDDVVAAANSTTWESYALELENVRPIQEHILVTPTSRSTWVFVEYTSESTQ